MILAVIVSALFFNANAEFVETVNKQIEEGYTWEYTGKHDADPNTPHIAADGKVYFTLTK